MNWLLTRWKELIAKNKLLYFFDVILKSYGQIIICLNPISGLLVIGVLFYLSKVFFLLSLLAVISSVLTAFIIKAKTTHINSGICGFNAAILGIVWLWFLKLNLISIILLVITAIVSSLLMKLLIDINSQTKTNLPVFSIPSVILLWLIFILLRYFHFKHLIGPDYQIIKYFQIYRNNFFTLITHFSGLGFFKTFYKHIIIWVVIFLAIMVHSRISSKFFLISSGLTVVIVYCLGGVFEFRNIELYLYNALPCSIALGGTFLVLNRKVFLFTILGTVLVILITFVGINNFILPIFVAPFNVITILFIWLVKSGNLGKKQGFFALPMEFISTPEFGLEWYRGEKYADTYWYDIENKFKPEIRE